MGSRPWKESFEHWMDREFDATTVLTFRRGKREIVGRHIATWQSGRGRANWIYYLEVEDTDGKRHKLILDRKLHINGEPVVTWWDKQAHPWMNRPGAMH